MKKTTMICDKLATITLQTIDGHRIKRYLHDMSKPAPLTLEEACEDQGINYLEVVSREAAAIAREGKEAYEARRAPFYAFEQIGCSVFSDPAMRPEHEIRDPLGMWEGRLVFTGNWAMLAGSGVPGVSVSLATPNGLVMGSASYNQQLRKWVATAFGDTRGLARAEFR